MGLLKHLQVIILKARPALDVCWVLFIFSSVSAILCGCLLAFKISKVALSVIDHKTTTVFIHSILDLISV